VLNSHIHAVMSILLRYCRPKRWRLHIASGGVIGKEEAESTRQALWSGRYDNIHTLDEPLGPDNQLQMNDCWPVTSWSIVDYFLRPKPAYFAIKRELCPVTVGITRKEIKTFANEFTAADYRIETYFEIWGSNSTLEEKTVTLEVKVFDLESDGNESGSKETWAIEVTLAPNASTEFWRGKLLLLPDRRTQSEVPKPVVVSARLLQDEEVVARYCNWQDNLHRISQ